MESTAFNPVFFQDLFLHRITLNNIHRQDEPEFIKVNELERGMPSEETNNLILNNVTRPLEIDASVLVSLHAKNLDAEIVNYNY